MKAPTGQRRNPNAMAALPIRPDGLIQIDDSLSATNAIARASGRYRHQVVNSINGPSTNTGPFGVVGVVGKTNGNWTVLCGSGKCETTAPLYCFEQ
jgi:hypothetical protein